MARFPYYKRNVRLLGQLIAKAATNEETFRSFKADPRTFLKNIGLPDETTNLIDFVVVAETSNRKSVALPYRLNSEKLDARDTKYLEDLSNMFPRNHLN